MIGRRTEPIGFIGVGEIAGAMVTGLSRGPEPGPQILLSPRGAVKAADLATRFPTVRVCASNQEVASHSAILVLSIRPDDAVAALKRLHIADDTVVVSVMAGVSHSTILNLLDTSVPVIRAIPMPAVRHRTGLTATLPPHAVSTALFDRLGGTLPISDETTFAALSVITGTVSSFLQYLSCIATWGARYGMPCSETEHFVRSLFASLAPDLSDRERSLCQLVQDHETPGGINEQLRATWLDESNRGALGERLDALLARLAR